MREDWYEEVFAPSLFNYFKQKKDEGNSVVFISEKQYNIIMQNPIPFSHYEIKADWFFTKKGNRCYTVNFIDIRLLNYQSNVDAEFKALQEFNSDQLKLVKDVYLNIYMTYMELAEYYMKTETGFSYEFYSEMYAIFSRAVDRLNSLSEGE